MGKPEKIVEELEEVKEEIAETKKEYQEKAGKAVVTDDKGLRGKIIEKLDSILEKMSGLYARLEKLETLKKAGEVVGEAKKTSLDWLDF